MKVFLKKNKIKINNDMCDNDADTDEEQIKLEKEKRRDNVNEICQKFKENPNYFKENLNLKCLK